MYCPLNWVSPFAASSVPAASAYTLHETVSELPLTAMLVIAIAEASAIPGLATCDCRKFVAMIVLFL